MDGRGGRRAVRVESEDRENFYILLPSMLKQWKDTKNGNHEKRELYEDGQNVTYEWANERVTE